jgi:hypothetical protein
MECTMEKNKPYCNCSYEPCSRKLKCCDCLHFHRRNGQLPACFFNATYEKTYDRSVANFLKMQQK